MKAILPAFASTGLACKLFAQGAALRLLSKCGLDVRDLALEVPSPTPGHLRHFLERMQPSLILTGTSGDSFAEKHLWAAARSLGIPSVGVLDQWINYGVRFSAGSLHSPGNPREYSFLPDKIFVMDELARREMIAEGLPVERILVTGQPHLDLVRQQSLSTLDSEDVRQELNIPAGQKIWIFFSEPISTAYGSRNPFGFDERSTLAALLECLAEIDGELDSPLSVIIKLHPKERPEFAGATLASRVYQNIRLQVEGQMASARLLAVADCVLGMASTVLVEAAVCGIPLLSLQFGGLEPSPLVLCRAGLIEPVRTREELSSVLRARLKDPPKTGPVYPLHEGSGTRIVQLIQGMIDQVAIIQQGEQLALLGGPKTRTEKFPAHRTIGEEEKRAAERVLDSGILSRFLGIWHQDFHGGPEVQAFEREWADYFEVRHAVAVNSATSALFAAVGAIGLEPGDEVIVSPYSMSASAVAPLIYSAIPVFADIETDYYCLDPHSVEEKITDKTKAIIVVDIFGLPYDHNALRQVAERHNLQVIEDCAQAPGAHADGRPAGTLGDVGIYSLNYHKHVHAGEGGMLVTEDDEIADRLRLIRNHAESVVLAKGCQNLSNMVGFNYRMTELEAAIGREQLKKLKPLLKARRENVEYLNEKLRLPCLTPAGVRSNCTHSYYLHTYQFNAEVAGFHRDRFVAAVQAELPLTELRETEGVKIGGGYVLPIYLQPMFQRKIAFGSQGHPWSTFGSTVDYSPGGCPVAESMHRDILITHEFMRPGFSRRDLDDVVRGFGKVWAHRHELA